MKKLIFIFMSILTLSIGQKGWSQFYFRANSGIGLNLGSIRLDLSSDNSKHPAITNGVYGSFGKGINFGGGIGIFVYPNIGVELDIAYKSGGTIEYKDLYPTYSITTKLQSDMLMFAPSAIFTTDMNLVNPFVRAGCVLAFPSLNVNYFGTYHNIDDQYSDGVAVGFIGGFGATIKIINSMQAYTELTFTNINWCPESEYYLNRYTGEKYNITLKESKSEYESSVGIAPEFPFSSLGVNIGIIYTLW